MDFASSVLASAGRPYKHHIRLLDVDIVITFLIDALVMVVDGHGKIFLGLFLTDDILVKKLLLSPWVSGIDPPSFFFVSFFSWLSWVSRTVSIYDMQSVHRLRLSKTEITFRSFPSGRPHMAQTLFVFLISDCYFFVGLTRTLSIIPYSCASEAIIQ